MTKKKVTKKTTTKKQEKTMQEMVLEDAKTTETEVSKKTLDNTSAETLREAVSDVEIVGSGEEWKLICKVSSKKENWMKSTKALQVSNKGCLVQVTTQQGDSVAEAVTFVPGASIGSARTVNGKKVYILK